MSPGCSAPSGYRFRVAILVMAAALGVVPALVRATFSGSTATPIRLNRGFELPPAKSTLTPPESVAVTAVTHEPIEPATGARFSPVPDDVALVSRPERAPDPLRGPPIVPAV